jgi:hypothetical protein
MQFPERLSERERESERDASLSLPTSRVAPRFQNIITPFLSALALSLSLSLSLSLRG